MKKMISWNVNGLRACLGKGFLEYMKEADADIFCIQESKLQEGQASLELPGYFQYWNYAEKKGYSGTAMFTKEEPLSVSYGIGIPEHDKEGRVITAEFPDYYVITCYTPNSQDGLKRLDYRMEWEDAFLAYLKNLEKNKPVVFCGDLNVAHKEIDLKNPKTNRKNVPLFLSGSGRRLFLVVLPVFRQGEERRLADRLFLCVGSAEGPAGERRDPYRGHGKRSLPGGAGTPLGGEKI